MFGARRGTAEREARLEHDCYMTVTAEREARLPKGEDVGGDFARQLAIRLGCHEARTAHSHRAAVVLAALVDLAAACNACNACNV